MRYRGAPATAIYYLHTGGFAFFFTLIATINLVYQAEVARLNPLQLVLVGTLLESVTFVCEAPTGVVADIYSRRLSVIVGTALVGAGFLLEGSVPTFGAILLAQVLWGSGYTFISGAREAWLVDEVGEDEAGRVFLRAAQAGQFATLAGIVASVALASARLNLPILVGGASFLALALVLVVAMPERGFVPAPPGERGSWAAMGRTLRAGLLAVRGRPALGTVLAITVISGMTSEGFDRLWTVHLLDTFTFPRFGGFDPIVWFGAINLVAVGLSIGATEFVKRRVDTASHRGALRAMFAIRALSLVGLLAFGLATGFALALAAYWSLVLLRRVNEPIFLAWLNRRLDSRVRATVLSLTSQADAFGQIAGGPLLGVVATAASTRAALVTAALLLLPALPLYARILRRARE